MNHATGPYMEPDTPAARRTLDEWIESKLIARRTINPRMDGYRLKHVFERYTDRQSEGNPFASPTHIYCSEQAMTDALLRHGYTHDTGNAFNISQRSPAIREDPAIGYDQRPPYRFTVHGTDRHGRPATWEVNAATSMDAELYTREIAGGHETSIHNRGWAEPGSPYGIIATIPRA